MASSDCKYFDECSAPLCPSDKDSLADCYWYVDEEVCRKAQIPPWIRRQRKIVKLAADTETYFTHRMLERRCKLQPGIKGLDPNATDEQRERAEREWLRKHPALRELSEAEKAVVVERFSKSGGGKKTPSYSAATAS